jgi:plasmid maintenance system killer protein
VSDDSSGCRRLAPPDTHRRYPCTVYRLEALRAELKGFHSIRVNNQWRIVFRWTPDGPDEVDIRDYH